MTRFRYCMISLLPRPGNGATGKPGIPGHLLRPHLLRSEQLYVRVGDLDPLLRKFLPHQTW